MSHLGKFFVSLGRAVRSAVAAYVLTSLLATGFAATLTLVEGPAGSGLYSVLVNDTFNGVGVANADEWSFEGEIGDRVSVRIEAAVGTSRPRVRILNVTNTTLASFDASANDGVGAIYSYRITTQGTYRVVVYTDSTVGAYAMRVDLGRGVDLEIEANDSVATANVLVPKVGTGKFDFGVAGLIPTADATGDVFALGLIPAGASLTATAQLPGSTLTAGNTSLRLYEQRSSDKALSFSGGTYATVPHHAVFDSIETAKALTIEAWVFIRSWSNMNWFPIFDKYETTGDWGWILGIENNGGTGISFFNGVNTRATAAVVPSLNVWHHVAVTYDHGANAVRFYLDGSLIATRTSPGALLDTNGEPAYIGYSPSGGDDWADGSISELRLWNRALSTAEIQANYSAANPTGVAAVWNVTADYSTSNGNPNGVWTYGGMDTAFTTFTPHPNHDAVSWSGVSSMWLNTGASTTNGVPPGYFSLHPGPGTEPAVVRWTAPVGYSGLTKVTGQFLAGDSGTMQVAIRKNNAVIWSAADAGAFDLSLALTAGDTLDFAVFGGYSFGNTPLQLLISAVTEPTPIAPTEAGLVGLWRFDEGAGLVAADASPTGNNAILGGGDPTKVPTWSSGMIRSLAPVPGTSLTRTFTGQTTAWLQIAASANTGLSGRYFLTGSVTDTGPLQVLSTTFPAAGGTTTDYIQNFSITFDDELDPIAANTLANVELRSAGKDGTLGTADDIIYTLGAPNYVNGTVLNFAILDGPMQAGPARLTIGLGMRDRSGNPLSGTFTREFTAQELNGYRIENQSNDTFATATSMAASGGEQPGYGGGWRDGVEYASGGGNPYGVATADFNGDGKLDLVSANYNGGTIGVLLGNGDGTFGTAATYAAPNNPFTLAVGDVNGDGKPDILVTRINGNAVRVFLNTSVGGVLTFAAGVDYATGAQPHRLVLADLNGDGRLDIATANYSANTVSILYGNGVGAVGNGTFAPKVDFAVSGGPYAIAAGKLNGDDRVDLAVGTNGDNCVKVYYRQLDGSYTAGDVFTTGSGYPVWAVAIGDVNGDNRADLVAVQQYNSAIRRWHQQADGTLVAGAGFSQGVSTHGAGLLLQDLNGDGKPEVIGGGYYNLNVYENLGAGVFSGASYPTTNTSQYVYAIAAGDFNGDGRMDLVVPVIARDTLRVFLGRGPEPMLADGTGTIGRARGMRSSSGDYDYFSFYAKAGDRVFVSSETPNHAGSTGLLYRIYNAEGDEITNFYGNINPSNGTDGTGQGQFVAASSGRYYVRVDQWHGYYGEYRIVVATAPGSFDLESEGNNSAGAANGLTWTDAAGSRSAAVGGILSYGDPGDWFALGFLDAGTQVTLGANKPLSSGLNWVLSVMNSAGTQVISSAVNDPNLVYTIPGGAAGTYYARIQASSGADFYAQYRLALTVADIQPPTITGDTLPAEGSTVSNFFWNFSLNFSETLRASTVNNVANYELRSAGPNGVFDNGGDDEVYSIALSSAYSSGLSASYQLTDGPPQPGLYRFQAKTGLLDIYGNPLTAVYTRTFTVAGVPPFIYESRSNDTFATATSMAAPGGEQPGYGGGWRDGVEYAAGGANPYGVATADFNGDGKLDLVSANYNGGTIGVLLGNGDGTFGTAATYAAPNNPFTLAVGDVNGDGKPDILVTRINGNAVRVFLNTSVGGALTFAAGVDYATGAQPHRLVLADLNGDGRLDIATANYSANTVSILYGNGVGAVGDGTFAPKVDFAVSGGPYAIAAGKLNGDDRVDLVVGTNSDNNVKVYYRQLDGSYTAGDVFTTGSGYGVWAVAIGDVNGDGRADLVAVQQYNSAIRRWHQQADGTLVAGAGFSQGGSTHGAGLLLQDLNGDGKPEVIGGGYYNLNVYENLGAGVFSGAAYPTTNSSQYVYAIAAGDFNGDGRMDLVVPVIARDTLRVFLGRGPEPMLADGTGTLGRARGNRSGAGDYDYYSFYAKAGDRVFVSSETPNHTGSTGLLYRIYNAEGDEITNFYGNINPSNGTDGTGQGQFVASSSGRYYVRVDQWHGYYGEYRIVVATAPGNFDLESEGNNSAGAANGLTWTDAAGSRSAAVGGILSYGDPGDWFTLGFLDAGTQVTLGASKPLSSGLNWVLSVMNSAGTQVANSAPNAPSLVYTVPGGAAGTYYARIQASSGADFYAQYRLALTVADIQPPTITGDTLPAEGSTVSNFFWDFSLNFSETLRASTVNNVANYELRSAGPNGVFDNGGDDEVYSIVLSSAYSSGLSASYQLTDGPPQPGLYRFQAKTGLLDIYGNPLTAVYTRTFTVAGVPPYVYESRSNDTFATATSMAAPGGEQPGYGGGWRDGVEYASGGSNPYGVATADFNGDGKLDLVSANYNGGTIGVLLGNGDGTFGTAATYAAPNNPFTLAVGDVNGDGKPDILVTRINGNAVRVFLNTSVGGVLTFAAGVDYATGAQPHRLVLADLNGDGRLDIATANNSANTVSILYGNGVGAVGDGTFAAKVDFAVSGSPYSIAAGKLNGDDRVDLAVGTSGDNNVKVYYRQLDGSYTAGDVFTTGSGYPVWAVAIADVNGDNRADLVAVQQYNSVIRRWHQQADGTLVAGAGFSQGVSTHGGGLLLQDLNGDGKPEVIGGGYYNLNVFDNLGAGVFGGASYPTTNNSQYVYAVAAGDFNGDGRMDLVVPVIARNTLRVFLGRGPEPMPADGTGTLARARGNRSGAGDYDYFSFYAKAGDRVFVSSETWNRATSTGLLYRIYNPEGDEITNFYGNLNPSNGSDGTGQGQFVAPTSGKYYVRVDQWHGYYGEYRIVVATAPGSFDLESEANNNAGAANGLTWTQVPGARSASVGGIISYGDPGDWFTLGFLDVGTQVTLSVSKPPSSGLNWIVDLLNGSSTVVAAGAPGATPVAFTIPAGAAGTYYARIRASSGADFVAQYRLGVSLTDTTPPNVVASSLPAEGSRVTSLFDRFTLTFSKDMEAATVNNPASYELRAAGADAAFDTADDVVVPLVPVATYSSGLTVDLRTANGGPLPAGNYRFKALPGLLDRFINALTPVYTRSFGVDAIPGYTLETEPNGTQATATALVIESSQPDLFGAGGRGYRLNSSDGDYWSFNLQAGDRVYVQGEVPGTPANTGSYYQIFNPAGTELAAMYADNNGPFAFPVFTASSTGAYALRVSNWHAFYGEYRFRVYILRGALQVETEPNNTIATASTMTLVASGGSASGSMQGLSRVAGDLDYIRLGTLQAGTTVFLSCRLPARSTFVPIVSLYNAAGTLLAEATGGRAGDAVSQVPISVTGTYYALVRTSGSTSGIDSEYVLDVLTVPTVDISFPNLQVTSLTPPPASGLKSGDSTTLSFRVDNLGNLATSAVTWIDRVVLSTDAIYGNADDIEIGVFPHSGPLNASSFYTVANAAVTIPEGVSGNYYVIVRTDHTNTVSEFVLEGDNETATENPIAITLATYPDLVIEGLAVTDPDGSGNRTASWTLANRGTGPAASGHSERFIVRNITTGTVVVNNVLPVASDLAAGATVARQATFATTTAGQYAVEVTADTLSQRFEYNGSGHTAAEANNVGTVPFTIIQLWTIAVAADPAVGGTVAGGGTFAEGSNRTVTATVNAPYLFQGWYEGTFLRAITTTYTSPLFANRVLTARYSLPAFAISTQVSPAGTGVVTGGGTYLLGANVSLSAAPVPGYLFSSWSEGATNLGTAQPLAFTAAANRTIQANFIEANPTHVVTTATLPAEVATITGARTYNNGEVATLTAPATVVSGTQEYVFVRFLLGGSPVGVAPTLTKTLTTLDPPALAYVAEYKLQDQKPSVVQVLANLGNTVAATSNYQLTLRFDRAMNTAVRPLVELLSANATSIPAVPAVGNWTATDAYTVPPIVITSANGGLYSVRVSLAQDAQNRAMILAEVYSFTVDVTAPPLPVLAAGATTANSAAVDWTGYSAPPDLASFRVYRSSATFTSLDLLSPVASLAAAARTYTFVGLTPDTDYFVSVVGVDAVGNALTTVTPLTLRVASTVPPAVAFNVEATATNASRVTWTFDPAGQIGFTGFKVYRDSAAFSSIAGMTPVATLAGTVRTYAETSLDRTQTYNYAVVAYNALGQSVTTVTSKAWKDPLSGTLANDFTVTEPVLVITQPLTISGGAVFTVPPGTVVAFGPGASLTVDAGRLVADGTLFAPIVFTSLADVDNTTRTRGSWNGITLADGTRSSTLRNVWIKYGKGLAITGGSHTVDTLGSAWNEVGGLRLSGGVSLTTQTAYLSDNAVGASIAGGASLTLTGSVLRNNGVNASGLGGGTLNATGNWWGMADPAAIAASVTGTVNTASPLPGEPVLTRGLRPTDGAASTGVPNLPIQLASLNASGYRVSEDSSFNGVVFVDVPRSALSSDLFNTAPWATTFPLSAGGGPKTIYAQFRSPTGALSPTVSFTTNYITTGPVISAFSLTEGQTINRPVMVSGAATSALPLVALNFYVDEVLVATSITSPLSARWDITALTPGVHRVRFTAVDSAGNLAARSLNVVLNPNPPPRPVITSPATGAIVTVAQATITGTAEPLIGVRLLRNGAVVATMTAAASGAFSAANIPLVEGANQIVATAFDGVGTTDSAVVTIVADTGAPPPPTLKPVAYTPGQGLVLDWSPATGGEVPTSYRVFWHNAPFTLAAQATGQSAVTTQWPLLLTNVPDGLRYFGVVGYDAAGNASALSNVVSFTVDLTPPSFAVAFSQSMPVGPGSLGITVTASEPLTETPLLVMQPNGGAIVSVTLSPAGGNAYTATFPVTTLSALSGVAKLSVSGLDLARNRFTGAPAGPALVFDVTKPTGALTTSPLGPIKTTSDVTLSFSLVLSELPKVGTTPTLSFSPPVGSAVPIVLAGSGLNWSGQLTLTAAMDNGFGTFLLNVQDAVGNAGTVLTSGDRLELYNTATPSAAAVPGGIAVLPLKGGYIRVSWTAADRAQSYRLYREAGASAAVPTAQVTADITALTIDDLPPADGPYRYVVTSFRLGAESGPSGVRATTSDRTPPPAPTTTTAVLGPTGINIAWTPAAGEIPAKWIVYRNNVAITTINDPAATSFVDSPPRGVMTYAVAAADVLGNEAKGPVATIELYVGAVANLRAVVDSAIGTTLTWTSADPTATGYNVYRNGAKQNATPLSALTYTDAFAAGGQPVQFAVTARNAVGQESAIRNLLVQPVTAVVNLNPTAAGDQPSVARYFDNFRIAFTVGAAASAPVALGTGEIVRTVAGETPVAATFTPPTTAAAGETKTVSVVLPATNLPNVIQGASITLGGTPDAGGSSVQYRFIQDFAAGVASGLMINVSAAAQPLAGGLSDFTVQVFNRGYAPADLVLARAGNTQPGDLEMLIINSAGVLLSATPYQGPMAGTIINGNGDTFLRVEPGASVSIPFRGVLVPESLGVQSATFRARFKAIYNSVGAAQQRVAGPLEGSTASSLRVTPYYGSAVVAQPAYSDDQPVVITGQALDRTTALPVPGVPLRIGIKVRGAVIYQSVVTDAAGAYSYSYTPSLGLAGDMVIWAAHPDVVDQLNQARVSFYRLFAKPGRVEAVMSKNDVLDFDAALVNPGDLALSGPGLSFRAYRIVNGAEVPVTTLTAVARTALPATIAAQGQGTAALRLQAALDAPDDALIEFTFTTAQGASTKLSGTVSLRPALAVLSTTSPTAGFAEAGVGRGQLKSVEVTVQNRGLRALTGVKLVPPAAVPWMHVQVSQIPDVSGNISLPDIPIGGTRTFTVVFAPPDSTAVGFYNDFLLIKGDNSVGDYRLNLFATVTSEQRGAVRFSVVNTFANPVPNTSIWLRNSTLGTEIGPVVTDVLGQVVVPNLMEGEWQWKTSAPGHGATQGVVTVVPNQTVGAETELEVVMVTVKFSVVPVAFTDYYEIKIEQTFQTHTPIPNLILSPPSRNLDIEPGWTGTLMYTLRNEGLRSMFDVTTTGRALPTMRLTPLVTYIPELLAQQTVEIPVYFEYFGPAENLNAAVQSASSSGLAVSKSGQGGAVAMAPSRAAASGGAPTFAPNTAAGAGAFVDCFLNFQYASINLSASGGVICLTGTTYTASAYGSINVTPIINTICGLSTAAGLAGFGYPPLKVVCLANLLIKIAVCAAAQLPPATLTSPGITGPGTGGSFGGWNGIPGSGWSFGTIKCFTAGTLITLADGTTRRIESIGRGDRLLAGRSGQVAAVAEVMTLSSDHLRQLTFHPREVRNATEESLRLTHDHRVWVDGRGWVPAVDVKVGDWLHGADGRMHEVTSNERLPGHHEVYGLHMAGDNVVYASGVLVEDQCFQLPAGVLVRPPTGGTR